MKKGTTTNKLQVVVNNLPDQRKTTAKIIYLFTPLKAA